MEYGELIETICELIRLGAVRPQAIQDIRNGRRLIARNGEILTEPQFRQVLRLHPAEYTDYVRIPSNRVSN